jgi:hypothetical protein
MNDRILIVTFVSCFLLTVAFVSIQRGDWNRATHGNRNALPADGVARGSASPSPAATAAAPGTPHVSAVSASESDPAEASYPDYSQADAPREPAAMEVPVILTVEDSTATGRREAIIRNVSPQPLDVRVTAINPPAGTRSTVQASIPPRRKTNLTDQGLVVVAGSQILVESPPYLQQLTTVY